MKSQKKKSNEENKTGEKMIIKLKEETVNEIIKDELKKEKKERPVIFNNKKNNKDCSDLLKNAINTEKQLLVLPYPKEKQKIVKTLNEIGRANGISYPTNRIIKGTISDENNYKAIIRDDNDNKLNSKTHKLSLNRLRYTTAEINL